MTGSTLARAIRTLLGIRPSENPSALLPSIRAARALQHFVEGYDVEPGVANSLSATLGNVVAALEAGRADSRREATNGLRAFIQAVDVQRGKALVGVQADELTDYARRLIAALT
jgi:hypothetical protein